MRNLLAIGIIIITLHSGLHAQEGKVWTLEECIQYALDQNLDIRKSGLTIMTNEERALQAKAGVLPSVNASVSQNFSWNRSADMEIDPITNMSTIKDYGSFKGGNNTSYGINSNVTLFNGGRLNNEIKQSDLNIQSSKYNLETIRESVSLNILNAFLQVLFAEEQVRNTEKQIESTTGQLNLATERLNLRIISQADYLQVKSQLASEKLSLANAQSQLSIARVNLMQMMELPVTDEFQIAEPSLEESLNQQRSPMVTSIFDTAMAIKPQIKSAALDKEIAQLDEKIAKAGYLPSLSANAGISTGASIDAFTGDDLRFSYADQMDHALSPSAGLTLSIPIYQKRQVKTSVALAKINAMNAEISETATKNQLRKNIEQACQDVISAQAEYEASLEKYQSTKESSALSDEKFNQGIINSVDYIVSKTNLIVSESQLLQSKYNLIFSYKILDFYTGIPLTL